MMNTEERMESSNQATTKVKLNPKAMRCANCGIRERAEANPDSVMSRLWKWHTGWCPGWNAYQKALAEVAK
jgi:hypothetical protein